VAAWWVVVLVVVVMVVVVVIVIGGLVYVPFPPLPQAVGTIALLTCCGWVSVLVSWMVHTLSSAVVSSSKRGSGRN